MLHTSGYVEYWGRYGCFTGNYRKWKVCVQVVPERTFDIVWNVVRVAYSSGNSTGSTFILKGSILLGILNILSKFSVGNYLRSFKEWKMWVGVIIWNVEAFNMILMQCWCLTLVRNWGGYESYSCYNTRVGIVGWCNNEKDREIKKISIAIFHFGLLMRMVVIYLQCMFT